MRYRPLLTLAVLSFLTGLSLGFGDDTHPAADQQVVITATKEPESPLLLTVPVEVSHADGATSLADWLSRVPGVSVTQMSPGQATLRAATFGENGFGRIQILVDGVSQNNPDMAAPHLSLIPMAALDRIESLGASGSALYGDQAVTGAVNLVTKVPKKFSATLSGDADTEGTNHQGALFEVPWKEGGLLVAAERSQVRPQRANSQDDSWNLWLKAMASPGVDQTITLTGSGLWETTQLPGSLTKSEYDHDPDSVEAQYSRDKSAFAQQSFAGTWQWTPGLARITVPLSGSWQQRSADQNSYSFYTDTDLVQGDAEPRAEMTFEGVGGGDLTVAGAVDGQLQQLVAKTYSDSARSSLKVEATLQRKRSATWLSAQQNWNDEWLASLQGRLEATVTTAQSDEEPALNHDRLFTPWAASAGVAWLPNQQTQFALNLGRTFRYPFLDEMVSYYHFSNNDSFNTDLDPETGWDATMTARGAWKSVQVSTSFHSLWMDNEILSDSTGTNKNEASSWHFSTDSVLRWDGIEVPLVSGQGLVSADYMTERAFFTAGPYKDKSLPLVPRQTLKGRVSWFPWSFLEARTEAQWSDEFYQGGDLTNSLDTVPAHWRWNASMTLAVHQAGDGKITIFVRNIGDDRTPDFVYYSGWYPADGRVLGASVTWSW